MSKKITHNHSAPLKTTRGRVCLRKNSIRSRLNCARPVAVRVNITWKQRARKRAGGSAASCFRWVSRLQGEKNCGSPGVCAGSCTLCFSTALIVFNVCSLHVCTFLCVFVASHNSWIHNERWRPPTRCLKVSVQLQSNVCCPHKYTEQAASLVYDGK